MYGPADQSSGSVLIIGGGRGIGRATATLIALAGHPVVLTFREDETRAQGVAEAILRTGGRAKVARLRLPGDDVAEWFGRIDALLEKPLVGLVNNVAYVPPRRRLMDADLASWRLVFEVNVLGVVSLCREAIARMATSRGGIGGSIVNVSSQVAAFGAAELSAYAASKGAVNALTLSLARECGREGVRVNAVSPGLIVDEDGATGDERQRAQVEQIPLGRLGQPTDVGSLIAWLVSPQASFVTGTVIPVHGGR